MRGKDCILRVRKFSNELRELIATSITITLEYISILLLFLLIGISNEKNSTTADTEQYDDTQDYTQQDQYQGDGYEYDYNNYDEYSNYEDTNNTGEYYEDPNDIVDHSYDDIAEQDSFDDNTTYSEESTCYNEYNSYYDQSAEDPSILQQQVTYFSGMEIRQKKLADMELANSLGYGSAELIFPPSYIL